MLGLDAERAFSVYPPISPVALASMLTGELPNVHGIHDRSREMAVPDIFEKITAMGKKSAYVEGYAAMLKTSVQPVLSPGPGGGDSDEDVYWNAIAAMEDDPDFLFVHFHGIDDVSHGNGPFSAKTNERILLTDMLVSELAARWSGKIIITADHGQHLETGSGAGAHGEFRAEDMIVPYMITSGGRGN
jgi:predicted AlkP superfamily pyrophosphatase or phosphodiesterase